MKSPAELINAYHENMLTANKSIWFEKLFGVYNRNLLKRNFHSFWVHNFQELKTSDKNIPLIIYANHSSWWDGLILFEILKTNDFESYALMEEKQLSKYRLFRKLGAFSIIRENFRESIKSLNYAVEILSKGKNKTLLIFPQGEIFPNDKRPLEFFNGLSYLITKLDKCTLIPCSVRLEFIQKFKPEIFVKLGESEFYSQTENLNRKSLTKHFEEKLTENLDLLKSDIIENKFDDFQKIF